MIITIGMFGNLREEVVCADEVRKRSIRLRLIHRSIAHNLTNYSCFFALPVTRPMHMSREEGREPHHNNSRNSTEPQTKGSISHGADWLMRSPQTAQW